MNRFASFNKMSKQYLYVVSFVIILVLVIFTLILASKPYNPIPKSIQKAVSFSIYYPNKSQLPKGYSLNLNSVSLVQPNVVIYSVSYPSNQNIVISEQVQPSPFKIDQFISSYIPLHYSLTTPLGQAVYGAYNDGGLKSIISLIIKNGPWIIATAPKDINHQLFVKVINSLTD